MYSIFLYTAYTSLILFVVTFLLAVLLRHNGIIDILIEPIKSADDACIRALKAIQSPNDNDVQAIVFQADT